MTTETLTPIPTLDLKAQYETIRLEIEAAVHRVLESQHFILGPEVDAFERELAAYSGSQHAIGVASGSDALLLSLMALDIKSGDEVITTPYTFFATAGAIARLGAKPVFVDIEPRSFNIDPNQVQDYLSGNHPVLNDRSRFDHDPKRVKVLLPVHLFGQCADMSPLLEIAAQHNLTIIEDAAQAIGSRYQGSNAGTMGLTGCFSFFPSKNLGAAGDGGAIVTNDSEVAAKLQVLRAHGSKPKYFHPLLGMNSRLDALQAAILRVKLPYLDRWTVGRQEAATRYDELFSDLPQLTLPWRRAGDRQIFNQYVIRAQSRETRDRVLTAFKGNKIGCEIYYPCPMHLQECFQYLGYRSSDLPESESAANETMALPIYPELGADQQQRIASVLHSALSIDD